AKGDYTYTTWETSASSCEGAKGKGDTTGKSSKSKSKGAKGDTTWAAAEIDLHPSSPGDDEKTFNSMFLEMMTASGGKELPGGGRLLGQKGVSSYLQMWDEAMLEYQSGEMIKARRGVLEQSNFEQYNSSYVAEVDATSAMRTSAAARAQRYTHDPTRAAAAYQATRAAANYTQAKQQHHVVVPPGSSAVIPSGATVLSSGSAAPYRVPEGYMLVPTNADFYNRLRTVAPCWQSRYPLLMQLLGGQYPTQQHGYPGPQLLSGGRPVVPPPQFPANPRVMSPVEAAPAPTNTVFPSIKSKSSSKTSKNQEQIPHAYSIVTLGYEEHEDAALALPRQQHVARAKGVVDARAMGCADADQDAGAGEGAQVNVRGGLKKHLDLNHAHLLSHQIIPDKHTASSPPTYKEVKRGLFQEHRANKSSALKISTRLKDIPSEEVKGAVVVLRRPTRPPVVVSSENASSAAHEEKENINNFSNKDSTARASGESPSNAKMKTARERLRNLKRELATKNLPQAQRDKKQPSEQKAEASMAQNHRAQIDQLGNIVGETAINNAADGAYQELQDGDGLGETPTNPANSARKELLLQELVLGETPTNAANSARKELLLQELVLGETPTPDANCTHEFLAAVASSVRSDTLVQDLRETGTNYYDCDAETAHSRESSPQQRKITPTDDEEDELEFLAAFSEGTKSPSEHRRLSIELDVVDEDADPPIGLDAVVDDDADPIEGFDPFAWRKKHDEAFLEELGQTSTTFEWDPDANEFRERSSPKKNDSVEELDRQEKQDESAKDAEDATPFLSHDIDAADVAWSRRHETYLQEHGQTTQTFEWDPDACQFKQSPEQTEATTFDPEGFRHLQAIGLLKEATDNAKKKQRPSSSSSTSTTSRPGPKERQSQSSTRQGISKNKKRTLRTLSTKEEAIASQHSPAGVEVSMRPSQEEFLAFLQGTNSSASDQLDAVTLTWKHETWLQKSVPEQLFRCGAHFLHGQKLAAWRKILYEPDPRFRAYLLYDSTQGVTKQEVESFWSPARLQKGRAHWLLAVKLTPDLYSAMLQEVDVYCQRFSWFARRLWNHTHSQDASGNDPSRRKYFCLNNDLADVKSESYRGLVAEY
ncbi:unnamed protein product, partial [Amoebophrya sp. A25]